MMNLTSLSKQCGNIQIRRNLFSNTTKAIISKPDLLNKNLKNTILDEDVLQYGGYVHLPIEINNYFGKKVQKVIIPNMNMPGPVAGHIVLNDIQIATEKLLVSISQLGIGNIDTEVVEDSAERVWKIMAKELVGKSGLFNTYILGFRALYSGKGHIATDFRMPYDHIKLPQHIYVKFIEKWKERKEESNTEGKPYVIAFRNPLLHNDSMRKLYILPTKSNRIIIHPIITDGMGADSDGDLIETVLGYPDIDIEEDWSTTKWDKEFLIDNQEETPDLENIIDDGVKRISKFRVIGPHDLIDTENSETIKAMCNAEDIDVKDLTGFFKGKSLSEIREDDIKVAKGLILQKSEIGKAGAAACRARVLADGNIEIAKAADKLSEQANQRLFDSKHKLDESYVSLIKVLKNDGISDINVAREILKDCEIDVEQVEPYLNLLYNRDNPKLINDIVDAENSIFYAVFDPRLSMVEGDAFYTLAIEHIMNVLNNEDKNQLIKYLRDRVLVLEKDNDE